jgi:hypothetical protein
VPDIEKRLGIIKDIVLPLDVESRYDIYFTDRRIAIVFMGSANRFSNGSFGLHSFPAASAAVTPPLTYVESRSEVEKIEEELSSMPVNDILKLSKKSCYYIYDEIEELRLVWGKKPKFAILSEDSESKFAPNEAQFKQLIDLLSTIEPLSSKLEVAGNWKDIQGILTMVVCDSCGVGNELDAMCCVNCGQKIKTQNAADDSDVVCKSCATGNRAKSLFCKQCGAALNVDKNNEDTVE